MENTTMTITERKWFKFLLGFVLVAVFLASTVAVLPGWIATYGATDTEVKAFYPGDQMIPNPVVQWTHAETIRAPVDKVWPWIAQIGQSKGGFYSYTFIENLIAGDGSYQNAARIIPEFQNPLPGDEIIKDMLAWKEIKPNEYILAATDNFFGLHWTWGWYLKSIDANSTRLILRMKIRSEGEQLPQAALFLVNAGGFIMENCMIRGIRERAEGRAVLSPNEPLEISIWVVILLLGLFSAWLVINRRKWISPLILGLSCVIALIVFTFIQPEIWMRIVLTLGLLAASWLILKSENVLTKKE